MVGFSCFVWQVKNTTHQSKADALPIHVIRECWWFRACNLRVVIFLALLGSPGGSAFASSIVANNGNTFLGIFIEHGNHANRRIPAIASSLEEVRRQGFNHGEGAADDAPDKPDNRGAPIAPKLATNRKHLARRKQGSDT